MTSLEKPEDPYAGITTFYIKPESVNEGLTTTACDLVP